MQKRCIILSGGGYFEYLKQITENAVNAGKLNFHKRAVRIKTAERTVHFSDGTKIIYDELYSSIPLPEMVGMMEEVPQIIKDKARRLEHTGVALVSIGLCACKQEKLWFYIYDKDIMAARAYMPSVKSSGNVPAGCASIQFEIYFNAANSEAPEEKIAVENCLYALEKLEIAGAADVLFTDFRVMPYGNVICLKQTEKDLPEIISWLLGAKVIPIGRFGKWEYLWSDQAFMSGYRAIRNGNILMPYLR